MNEHIQTIGKERAFQLIDRHYFGTLLEEDKGLFIVRDTNGTFTAIDNSTENCWTEDFKTRFEAVRWLCGKEKKDERIKDI